MKRFTLILLASLIVVIGYAQEERDDKIQTIFKSPPEKISGFISPITSSSMIDGEYSYYTGMQGALLLNNKFFVGGYRLRLQNDITSEANNLNSFDIDYESKGLLLGYVILPDKLLHLSVSGQFGRAEIELYDNQANDWIRDNNVFEVTPVLELEFNVTRWCKIGLGANYRFAFDVDRFANYDDNDFFGVGAFGSIKLGWFY